MLTWLPPPSDFRAELHAARGAATAPERLARLASLAAQRLGFLETLQLDRALAELPAHERGTPGGPLRLALLASSTADHLVPAIRVGGLRRNVALDVHLGPYAQHRQQLLDGTSSLHRFAPQFVLLSLTAREVAAAVSVAATAADVDRAVRGTVDELRTLWSAARTRLGAAVIQQTYLDTSEPLFGHYDRLVPAAPAQVVAALNDAVAQAASAEGVLLLDVARLAARSGLRAWFDVTSWLQAKIEIAHAAAPLYGDHVARVIAAQRGQSRKCLVLDLDNTLWGGVVGDDGIDGLVLGEGSAPGEAYLAFQRYAKQLGARGVILAVCSKNDPGIADAAFRNHPEMILQRSDIAAFRANWDDKTVNLRSIADELNVGLDSLVFVDDNPAERARIRQALPMVAVPELPADVAHYVSCLAEAGYFEAVAFTADDRQRGAQYAANAQRHDFEAAAGSLEDFLRGLDMSLVAGPFRQVDVPRVAQLINKTNQFNPTTRRRSAPEVAELARNGDAGVTLQLRLADRFGDNGLVSAMILRPAADERAVLDVDTWVMSCRVFGRELEFEALNIAVELARERGAVALRADYVPTAKNGVVKDLYPTLGFVPLSRAPAADGVTRWLLPLDAYRPRPTHIRREAGAP